MIAAGAVKGHMHNTAFTQPDPSAGGMRSDIKSQQELLSQANHHDVVLIHDTNAKT